MGNLKPPEQGIFNRIRLIDLEFEWIIIFRKYRSDMGCAVLDKYIYNICIFFLTYNGVECISVNTFRSYLLYVFRQ